MKRHSMIFSLSVLYIGLSSVYGANSTGAAEFKPLPAPQTVSAEMQQALTKANPSFWLRVPSDTKGWHEIQNAYVWSAGSRADALAQQYGVTVAEEKTAGIPTFRLMPAVLSPDKKDKIVLYFHGGGYFLGHARSGLTEAVLLSGLEGWPVLSVDYRMAPDHPYPAAIEDGFAVYQELLKHYRPENIAVFGTSTGGAMTLILGVQAAQNGTAMPGALIAGTPWADIDKIGDSYVANEGVDNVLGSYEGLLRAARDIYAGGQDLRNPLISPVYAGSGVLSQFPPTLLVSGSRDLFLSNTVRMHKKLLMNGRPAELIVHEALSHAQYYLYPSAPETRDHYRMLGSFLERRLIR